MKFEFKDKEFPSCLEEMLDSEGLKVGDKVQFIGTIDLIEEIESETLARIKANKPDDYIKYWINVGLLKKIK